ncbi:conserved hypothetical protein [Ricinus communis]|uniref:Uncharacterized protein n=1 Tax=Ricinus communis TaxID=3988 RepID=B9RL21_RICCO|nr:conserved hypothetical protein [Ricinus communis]
MRMHLEAYFSTYIVEKVFNRAGASGEGHETLGGQSYEGENIHSSSKDVGANETNTWE